MTMPIGIMTNVLTVAIAGALGGVIKNRISQNIITNLTDIFGFCSITIGITVVSEINNVTVVIISILLGTIIGAVLNLDGMISGLISKLVAFFSSKYKSNSADSQQNMLCMMAVIVCFSGTGIFGAISEGLEGNSSILLAKSVMDFASILIFSVRIGGITALFSIPQAVIFITLYFAASFLAPLFNTVAIRDFKAVGAVITVVIGYNLLGNVNGWKNIKILNMIPSLAIVLIISNIIRFFS